MAKLRVGICGFGGLGRMHARSLAGMEDVEIASVCDIDPAKLAPPAPPVAPGAFDIGRCRTYADLGAMLRSEALDVLVNAAPTDVHAELAVQGLGAGCHVFSEKPIAIDAPSAKRMIEAGRRARRNLMIGHCLRFWCEYEMLRAMIADRRHGALLALDMVRIGGTPRSDSWYVDHRRSGGAILDLHIHDVDWCLDVLGVPERVQARARRGLSGGLDDVSALWSYRDGPVVTLRGSWRAQAFTAGFRALFEQAQVEYAGATGGLQVTREGVREDVPGDGSSAYANEMRYFLDCCRRGERPARCLPEASLAAVEMIKTEREAAAKP